MEQPQRKETYKHGKETSSFICIHQFFFILFSCQSTRTEFNDVEREHSEQIARLEQAIYSYGDTIDGSIKSISGTASGMGATIEECIILFERYNTEIEYLLSRYKRLEQYCKDKGYKDTQFVDIINSPSSFTHPNDNRENRSLYP